MKPNLFLTLMAVILSFLSGYLIYNIAEGKPNDFVCGIVSMISLLATFIPIFGIKYKDDRLGINIRVLSAIVFIILLAINLIYAYFGVTLPNYIIIVGIIVTLYMISFYRLSQTKVS